MKCHRLFYNVILEVVSSILEEPAFSILPEVPQAIMTTIFVLHIFTFYFAIYDF